MLPYQRKKVDISKLTPQEQQLFSKYGKLPTHKNILTKMQKERKYFDSGDYALSKAGVTPQSTVGTAIPNPENIPHASPSVPNGHQIPSISPTTSTSPVNRESSLSQMNIKPDTEGEGEEEETEKEAEADKTDKANPTGSTVSDEVVTSTAVETPRSSVKETKIETEEVKDIDMAV